MRVAITGSTGLIGSALVDSLRADGHDVVRVHRAPPARAALDGAVHVVWDPTRGAPDPSIFERVDGVVHLSGANIAQRWTPSAKAEIRSSRVDSTRALAQGLAAALGRLESPPRTLVCASAVGIYGSRGEVLLDEQSAPGSGFLAEVARGWEEATRPASDAGVRVVNTRFGVVLSAKGGALEKMLTPFKLGAGGKIGDGRQWMSWIARDDVVGVIRFALAREALAGPVNATSPSPVRNAEFADALGRVLHRPTIATVPAFALRLLYGSEMADETLLASQRAVPRRLEQAGFRFRHPEIADALAAAIAEK